MPHRPILNHDFSTFADGCMLQRVRAGDHGIWLYTGADDADNGGSPNRLHAARTSASTMLDIVRARGKGGWNGSRHKPGDRLVTFGCR